MDNNYNSGSNSYSYGENPQGMYDPNMNYIPDGNKKKNGGFGKGVALGIALTLLAFCIIIVADKFIKAGEKKDNSSGSGGLLSGLFGEDDDFFTSEEMEKLAFIEKYIESYSYYEQDRKKMMDSIYSALLSSLEDNYAVYYNEEAFASMMQSSAGEYYGIGCVVTKDPDTGYVKVVQPYEGSPSYEAGLAIGDLILKVDDKELQNMDLNEAVAYIQGKEGTSVKITYMRDGKEKTVEVTRRKIEIPTVAYKMMEGDIGYVQVTQFDDVTTKQFSDAVDKLVSDGAKGLIFDVRSNPGGMYDTVVEMLDKLLPEGVLVYTEDKNGRKETEYSDAAHIDLPMAVLINGDSASASEIFAGAMKDYDAAEIIGTTSFGKGIVQSVIPIGDGSGMKFTISSYFTPSGVCIHGIGIEPDVTVELPKDEEAYDENGYLKDGYDTQLNAAIDYINSASN